MNDQSPNGGETCSCLKDAFAMTPRLNPVETRVVRDIRFDLSSFDALQDAKRLLSEHWGRLMTNAETLRVVLLSHPLATQNGLGE